MALTEGWNSSNVAILKSNIDATFAKLVNETGILDEIYNTVKDCWKGPDADSYLKSVHDRAKELIESVKTAYEGIATAISDVEKDWKTFQEQNQ